LELAELGAALGQPSSAGLNLEEATKDRIQLCSGLLVLDGDTVTLVHQSFKDYLLRSEPDPNPALEFYRINPEKGNCEIAERCLEYLSEKSPPVGAATFALRCERRRIKREPPFLGYAAVHWPLHAGASTSFCQKEHTFSSFFGHKKAIGFYWFAEYMGFCWGLGPEQWSDAFLWPNPLFMIATALLISNLALKYWQRPRTWEKLIRFREHNKLLALAFSVATASGNVEIARFLLSQGANVKRVYKRHSIRASPPLHLAAMNDREDMVKLLLSKTANLEIKDRFGGTALLGAVQSRASRSLLALLLEAGADVATSNREGNTPLHCACANADELAMRILLEAGGNANAIDFGGRTPLHRLVSAGCRLEQVELLLGSGASVEAKDVKGLTPLHEAVCGQAGEHIMEALIHHGAKVNSRTANGDTPLHLAAVEASPGVLGILLRKGANIKALDNNGKTAKQRAQDDLDNLARDDRRQSWRRMRLDDINKILQAAEEGNLTPIAASSTADSSSIDSTEFI
jgi:ankyrin repeat protein